MLVLILIPCPIPIRIPIGIQIRIPIPSPYTNLNLNNIGHEGGDGLQRSTSKSESDPSGNNRLIENQGKKVSQNVTSPVDL